MSILQWKVARSVRVATSTAQAIVRKYDGPTSYRTKSSYDRKINVRVRRNRHKLSYDRTTQYDGIVRNLSYCRTMPSYFVVRAFLRRTMRRTTPRTQKCTVVRQSTTARTLSYETLSFGHRTKFHRTKFHRTIACGHFVRHTIVFYTRTMIFVR